LTHHPEAREFRLFCKPPLPVTVHKAKIPELYLADVAKVTEPSHSSTQMWHEPAQVGGDGVSDSRIPAPAAELPSSWPMAGYIPSKLFKGATS
jgi:hypothetical protein